jgi:hypothetical protein
LYWCDLCVRLKNYSVCVDIETTRFNGPISVLDLYRPREGVIECESFVKGRNLPSENLSHILVRISIWAHCAAFDPIGTAAIGNCEIEAILGSRQLFLKSRAPNTKLVLLRLFRSQPKCKVCWKLNPGGMVGILSFQPLTAGHRPADLARPKSGLMS